ncbi:MAG: EAL domain-containing protein [Gammaproteobacteria bacterium]|nr:EAL domain-containing protein [Gammaproteobacteria bacterium]
MASDVDKLIRLLIIDEGLHKAEQITSSLRASGMHVRAEFAEDAEDMRSVIEDKALDIVLFSMDLPDFELKQAIHLMNECGRHLVLIAMSQQSVAEVIVKSIHEGAQDVVAVDNLEHLIQVIKREFLSLDQWRSVRRLDLQLQESEKRCQSLLANSKDAVAYVHEGMHIYANQSYMELFGNTDFDELEGTPIIDMVDASQKNEIKTFLREFSQNETSKSQLELKLVHSSGEKLDATLEFAPASYDGEPCTQILIRSAGDTAELEEKINYLHQHDQITNLYNHQFFMEQLKKSIALAASGSHKYSMIYIAIDNFQSIRDRVGISGCDILIGNIAKLLKALASKNQVVARFGAHSYSILSAFNDKAAIEKQARQIPSLVERHVSKIGDQSISATCTVSVIFIDQNSPTDINEILSRVEKTCDEAQKSGGNQMVVYVPRAGEMTPDEEDNQISGLIKNALANNRIEGLYQPIVSIKGQSGERYVSSLAVITSEGDKLFRNDYVAAATRTKVLKMLDRWAILHAIKKITETSKKSRKTQCFVPLCVDSIIDSGLTSWIAENIAKSKINASLLVFMVDEGDAVSQLKATKEFYKGLKEIKCQFGIDDFGTGLNPFQLVKHIKADYIRISAAYMENLAQNPENQESIREIANQAAEMGILSITPDVEDAAVLSVLWTLNVDFVFGDFLQAPEKALEYDFSSM